MGITTNEAISWLDDAVVFSNQNIGILAQVDKTREEIFNKIKVAYQRLPEAIRLNDWSVWNRPSTKYSTKKELSFAENNSWISVITDSRWWTWSKLHISEFAFINNAAELLAWTLPSVPKNWDIIIESTANGFWNEFEKLWSKYYWNDSYEWSCIFLGWWLMPEYSLPLYEWEVVKLPEELKHLNKPMIDWTILTEEQKKRYLNMYESQTNPDYAFQEYPSTPEEAFLTTWKTVFKSNIVKQLKILPHVEDDIYPDLWIYRKPREWQCVYGWDTSKWIPWGDNACIVVRDSETFDLLACYYWHIEPEEQCNVVERLIELWYRWRIWVENNNTWYAFYAEAKKRPRKSMCYVWETVDKTYDRPTQDIGWNTNWKTRPIMMQEYKVAVNKRYFTEQDSRIVEEMFTFIYDETGKEIAQVDKHDDWIISDSIARQMRKYPLAEY